MRALDGKRLWLKMTEINWIPRLGEDLAPYQLKIVGQGERKKEKCPSPSSQAQLHSLSPGFFVPLTKRHRMNLIPRLVTLYANRII